MRVLVFALMSLAVGWFWPCASARATQPRPAASVPAAEAKPDVVGPDPLTVVLPPGPPHAAVRLVQPYAQATATSLSQPGWDGTAGALSALIAAHQADLVLADGPTLTALCRAQKLDRLDWPALGGRDRFVAGAASDCGAGAYVAATVLAWDSAKLPAGAGTTAYTWGDFWDVARHPGRRGLRRAARGNLEAALMADGVSPGDVYRTLRSADGVDRAFRKLDQLKPYIEWWDRPEQPAQFLSTAKVLMTTAPAETLRQVPHAHPAMQWAGSLAETMSWARPAGAAHPQAAQAALLIASDAARQAIFAHETGWEPATQGGAAFLPQQTQGGLAIDEGFWIENGEKLESRFKAAIK